MQYLVVYKKGWPIGVYEGVRECAKKLGVTEDTVHFRCTPTYKKRHPDSFIVKVSLEE